MFGSFLFLEAFIDLTEHILVLAAENKKRNKIWGGLLFFYYVN